MSYLLRAGALNSKMTFQRRSSGTDSWGQPQTGWVDAFSCMVSVRPLGGRELVNAQAVLAEARHEVRMRYRADMTTALRGVYQGRIFNVLSVSDDNFEHRSMTLLCSEGAEAAS